jgi:hypothetical protein
LQANFGNSLIFSAYGGGYLLLMQKNNDDLQIPSEKPFKPRAARRCGPFSHVAPGRAYLLALGSKIISCAEKRVLPSDHVKNRLRAEKKGGDKRGG